MSAPTDTTTKAPATTVTETDDAAAVAAARAATPPAKTGGLLTRPGGRSARVRADVHQAARELLAEGAGETLTVPQIAQRAGVHPTTVYRRWGSVGEILVDVTASRVTDGVVVPDTGSLAGDLKRWVEDVAVDLADPDVISLMRASIGSGLAEGCAACVVDRRAQLDAIITRDEGRGGTPPDMLHAADMLLGPLYYRAIFLSEPADAGWAQRLVDQLLR